MKTVIINQARMTSTRLPGKVMMKVMGRPLLEIQIERLLRVPGSDGLVVATTTNDSDDPIVGLCRQLGVEVWRGSENDVLARYEGAARQTGADWVVRVTSDCPLIDPEVVGLVIQNAQNPPGSCDYCSNTLTRSYPRGLDAECFSAQALYTAVRLAGETPEREHVTPYLYRHPERFRVKEVVHPVDLSHHRWTVDTFEDFELVSRMLENLLTEHPDFRLSDCLNLLEGRPEWLAINAQVTQKTLYT